MIIQEAKNNFPNQTSETRYDVFTLVTAQDADGNDVQIRKWVRQVTKTQLEQEDADRVEISTQIQTMVQKKPIDIINTIK